jgi:hypothetical protein
MGQTLYFPAVCLICTCHFKETIDEDDVRVVVHMGLVIPGFAPQIQASWMSKWIWACPWSFLSLEQQPETMCQLPASWLPLISTFLMDVQSLFCGLLLNFINLCSRVWINLGIHSRLWSHLVVVFNGFILIEVNSNNTKKYSQKNVEITCISTTWSKPLFTFW